MRYLFVSLDGQEPIEADTASGYWQQLKKLIHNSIFIPEPPKIVYDSTDFIKGEEKFRAHTGKRLGSIHIMHVDLLAGSVIDTSMEAESGLARLLNNLHFSTKDNVIKNNILFKENNRIDPFELADTERILRRLSFIEDANILLLPRESNEEIVDCIIVIKDKFSIGFSYDPITATKHKFKIYDRNLIGYGVEFSNTFIYHTSNQSPYEYDGQIYFSNIQGTFISTQFNYRHIHKENSFSTQFSRGFITPKMKYAGGLNIIFSTELDNQITKDSYQLQDLWIGRSFQVDADTTRKNLIIAARTGQKRYEYRPAIFPDSNFTFHNYQLLLGSLTYRKINYLQTTMVLSFGTTEDIPYGYLFNMTAGVKKEEFSSKPYLGTTMAYADYLKNIGYFGFRTDFGTYLYQGDFIQSVWRNNFTYFTGLHTFNNYHLRTSSSATFSVASRRRSHEDFTLDAYIRQFSNLQVRGRQRATINLEPVLFTPWNLIGFKFALFAFGDLGFVTEDRFLFSKKNTFGSFGFGFRIRNESMVFNALEIRLAYLYIPREYDAGWRFHYTSSTSAYMQTVQFSRPDFITYE
jgi:hypothetical protein